MSRPSTRRGLIVALLAFVVGIGLVTDQFARHAVRVAGGADPSSVYAFAFVLTLVFVLFTTLPVLMIIAYRGLQGEMLSAQVLASLSLCALDDQQLQRRVQEYDERNSLSAFFLPSVVNLMLTFVVWDSALLPQGTNQLLALLGDNPHRPIGMAMVFAEAATHISPLTWALLGAYFYALNLIIRRWMLSDLTTNVLWKINVRLVVTFIVGSLLVAIASGPAGIATELGVYIAAFGFMVGLVPDLFLRWVAQQLKRVGGIDAQASGLFAPSDLQSKIDGMSFWQVDRLGEEGIEGVHDLAMKEIPSLLIKTRFDVPLLLNWVDRALLCTQVGDDLPVFKCAHVYTATGLVAALERPNGMTTLLQALHDGAATCAARAAQSGTTKPAGVAAPPPVSAAMIDNILAGLATGPNLRHLTTYRATVNRLAAALSPEPAPTAPPAAAAATPVASPPASPPTLEHSPT